MINKLYKSKYYPVVPQIIALVVFILLITGALGIDTQDAAFAKQLRNTNLSNLIVWSYWWPMIVFIAVLFGRHWCSVCPIEMVSWLSSRVGLNRKVPQFLKTGWLITILYAFIATVAIHTWGIHRIPHLMALYLISLLGLAILVSIIFEKRAFCSWFCPVGKLLSLYALLAPFGIRTKNSVQCKSCKTKDCISSQNNKLTGRSCQSGLYPDNINDNRDCILCTQCIKACPNENIEFRRIKKSYYSFNPENLRASEIGMISILIGFVAYEIMSSWKHSKVVLKFIPEYCYENLGITISSSLFEGIVLFILIPAIILFIISSISRIINSSKSYLFYLKRVVVYLVPILGFGHLFKALLKTSSRIPYWQYAMEDPKGVDYAQQILIGNIMISGSSLMNTIVLALGIISILIALYLSINKLAQDKFLDKKNQIFYLIILLLHTSLLLYGPIGNMV